MSAAKQLGGQTKALFSNTATKRIGVVKDLFSAGIFSMQSMTEI
jgi:hypothetical protein